MKKRHPLEGLDEEIREHIERETQENVDRGMPPAEARRQAMLTFGNVALAKEDTRAVWVWRWLDQLRQDVRYALRSFGRTPVFTVVALATIALGTGATTAIFSVVYGVLLRPLPFPDSDDLVMVQTRVRDGSFDSGGAVTPDGFLEWQAQSRAFQSMAAFSGGALTLTGQGEPALLAAAAVTIGFFDTLQARAAIGRTFEADEGTPGRSDVVVLSNRLWRQRFSSDRAAVGQSILLDSRPFTVVGVMPEGLTFPEEVLGAPGRYRSVQAIDLWTPFIPRPGDRANAYLRVIARLKPGITMAQAQSDMTGVARRLEEQAETRHEIEAVVVPLHDYVVADVRRLLLFFLGAVTLVLLIACVNVANLLVARAATRRKEVGVRSALGASRGRLIRQFLTESTLLGILGGSAGVLFAIWSMQVLVGLIPRGSVPRLGEVAIDVPVLAFTLIVSAGAGLVFGLAPVVHSARADVHGVTQTPALRKLNLLVVSEVALAVVVLTGAGLLIKSFYRLTGVDPGFRRDNVLTASVSLPESTYPTLERINTFHSQALERLSAVSGIGGVAAVSWLPFGGSLLSGDIIVDTPSGASEVWAAKPAVSPDYFRVMGIAIVRGRPFSEADTADRQHVVIVTESVASRLWADDDPIGKRLKLGFGSPADQPWTSVVGVVQDVKQMALSDDDVPAVYVPLTQAPRPFLLNNMTFVIRADVEPASVVPAIRRAFGGIDPDLPIYRMERLDDLIAFSVVEPRLRSVVLGAFAGIALVLVSTGILGVLMYSVTQRTREIGVRLALGAQQANVIGMVVRQGLTMAAIGVGLGLAGAAVLTRLLTSWLYDVRPHDPATYALITAVLAITAIVACCAPALRAARLNPVIALRSE